MNYYLGFCDHCKKAATFSTEAARDEFQRTCTHGHDVPVSLSDTCTGCDHRCGDHEWREIGIGPCCEDGCKCRAFAVKQ